MAGVVVGGKAAKGFATPSRKVEFFAKGLDGKKDAAGKAVNPLPAYEPRDWQPDADYPLYLINWNEASHTHTRTFNNPWLLELKDHNRFIIHPTTAKKLGISDGDEVVVESKYGKTTAKAKVSKRMHQEVVARQHGFGRWAGGSNAVGKGTADGNLRPTKADPLSGQSLRKENGVRVRKA